MVGQAIALKTGPDYDEQGIIENSVGKHIAEAGRVRIRQQSGQIRRADGLCEYSPGQTLKIAKLKISAR